MNPDCSSKLLMLSSYVSCFRFQTSGWSDVRVRNRKDIRKSDSEISFGFPQMFITTCEEIKPKTIYQNTTKTGT